MIHLQSIEQRRLPGSKTILPSDAETETEPEEGTEAETDEETGEETGEETEEETGEETGSGKCTHQESFRTNFKPFSLMKTN